MLAQLISRCVVIFFGVLLPGYKSYKALKKRDSKEHIKWMMHWVVFAAFYTFELLADYILCWIPFYYELKMAFIIWLICPITRGSSILYRRIIHPLLDRNEKEIDEALTKASENGYAALTTYGAKGLNLAATTVVTTVIRGQGLLVEQLKRRSYSMGDITTPEEEALSPLPETPASPQDLPQNRRSAYQRAQSDVTENSTVQSSRIYTFGADVPRQRLYRDPPANLYKVSEEPQTESTVSQSEKVIYVSRSNLAQNFLQKVTAQASSKYSVTSKPHHN